MENQGPRQTTPRLETIGRLAGGVAHDFNNLLTVILGYNELVLGNLDPADPRCRDLEEVRRAGRSAAALTRQLLAFSRQQELEPSVLCPNDLVTQLQKTLRRLISEDILLETDLAADCWSVEADCVQIEQVLLNLAVNASDAMPQGGRLVISTRNSSWKRPLDEERSVMPSGDYVVLSVSDNGVGMSEDVRSRLFEPYFTTKAMGRGSGLGLAIVYGIVKQSGGFIWVETSPGQGTRFDVWLPRTLGKPASTPEPHLVEARGSETILLAEDDDGVRSYAARALRDAGYRVLEAQDGADALQLAERHGEEIRLLITDVIMPSLSGPELLQCLGHVVPRVKALFVSGYPDDALDRHGISRPDVPLLRKPFSPTALSQKVRAILDVEARR